MKSTEFTLMRITACMGVWSDGHKAAPLMIHNGKEIDVITRKTGPLLASTQEKAWVKSDVLIK